MLSTSCASQRGKLHAARRAAAAACRRRAAAGGPARDAAAAAELHVAQRARLMHACMGAKPGQPCMLPAAKCQQMPRAGCPVSCLTCACVRCQLQSAGWTVQRMWVRTLRSLYSLCRLPFSTTYLAESVVQTRM